MKALCSFKMPGNTNPATLCHIPEDLNLQHSCYGNLRSHILVLIIASVVCRICWSSQLYLSVSIISWYILFYFFPLFKLQNFRINS